MSKFSIEICKQKTTFEPISGKINYDLFYKTYFNEHFFTLSNGDYLEKVNNKYEYKSKETIKTVYFNQLPDQLQKWFFGLTEEV